MDAQSRAVTALGALGATAAIVAASFAGFDFLRNREQEREVDRRTEIELVASQFVEGERDDQWADRAANNYAFPLDEYYDIDGPVDEQIWRAGDARFWVQTESLDFTVIDANVVRSDPDGRIQVNVEFDAVKNNRPDSGICPQERASKTVRLTLVEVDGGYKIKAEDDNSASYDCTADR